MKFIYKQSLPLRPFWSVEGKSYTVSEAAEKLGVKKKELTEKLLRFELPLISMNGDLGVPLDLSKQLLDSE